MAGTKVVAGLGVRDFKIAPRLVAPGTPGWIDVPGVTEASFTMGVSEVDQWGDDTLYNTFYHSQKGTLAVRATFLALGVIEALSGNPVTSSGSAESIDIGSQGELTPQRVSLRITVENMKTRDGATASMTTYLYNASVRSVWESIPRASLGALQEITLNFNVYNSDTDETGAALTDSAFGRVVVD
jgi:hypothetical protein